MSNSPDHFPKGTRVRLSKLGAEQRVARLGCEGWIKSPYPINQMVTVAWDYMKSPMRLHVDFLDPIVMQGRDNQ